MSVCKNGIIEYFDFYMQTILEFASSNKRFIIFSVMESFKKKVKYLKT